MVLEPLTEGTKEMQTSEPHGHRPQHVTGVGGGPTRGQRPEAEVELKGAGSKVPHAGNGCPDRMRARGWPVPHPPPLRSARSAGLGDGGGCSAPGPLDAQSICICRNPLPHSLEATLIVIRCDFGLFLSWERKTLTKKSLHI